MEAETPLFFAGEAVVALHRTETSNYRDNLGLGAPALWVALRPAAASPRTSYCGHGRPGEGEGFTDAGNYMVEQVPMPAGVAEKIGRFVAEHHVDRPFVKRRRDPGADASFMPRRKGEREMMTPETFVSRWARLKRNSDIRREMEAREDRVPDTAETSAAGVEAAIGNLRPLCGMRLIRRACRRSMLSGSIPTFAGFCKAGCPPN